jgi:biotin carboxylase
MLTAMKRLLQLFAGIKNHIYMKKILVANRGEIALRIMRSIRKMGINTVAVYSEADRLSPHVRFADEAVCLGPAASSQSYLNADRIIACAKELGVDGIHPGYGFLSENALFAAQVEAAGIIFIGPTATAMRIMGSKLAAKESVKKFNIPMVPGIDQAIEDIGFAKKIASDIGYPVLIKASAGGGGKACVLSGANPRWKSRCKGLPAKPNLPLVMVRYLLKNISIHPAILKCRCWPIHMVTSFIYLNGNAASSDDTRK